MARANVKIKTAKVLDLLRKKLADTQKQLAERPAVLQKQKAEQEAWSKKVVGSIPKTAKPAETSVSLQGWGDREGQIRVELTYYLPANKVAPKPPAPNLPEKYQLERTIDELQRTIKLLELTEEDTVSTSVYRDLAELL